MKLSGRKAKRAPLLIARVHLLLALLGASLLLTVLTPIAAQAQLFTSSAFFNESNGIELTVTIPNAPADTVLRFERGGVPSNLVGTDFDEGFIAQSGTVEQVSQGVFTRQFGLQSLDESVCSELDASGNISFFYESASAGISGNRGDINLCNEQKKSLGSTSSSVNIALAGQEQDGDAGIIIDFVFTDGSGELLDGGYTASLRDFDFTLTNEDTGEIIDDRDFNKFSSSGAKIAFPDLSFGNWILVATYTPSVVECINATIDVGSICDINFGAQTFSQEFPLSEENPSITYTYESQIELADQPEDAEEDQGRVLCKGFVLGWVLCGMTHILFTGIDFVFGLFVSVLSLEPLASNGNEGNIALYDLWNNMRIVANVVFIFVFMAAVIGQSFSWVANSYEFRKLVPRLALAAIGVQLSWYICSFAIDLFNVLGAGTRSLMLAPVQGLTSISFDFGVIGEGFIAALFTFSAYSGLATLGGLSSLGYLLPPLFMLIILFLTIAFGVVFLRSLVVYLLVITSPLAFVAWMLPGTQNIAKQWADTFMKLLIMYPAIIALVAAGELAARVITNTGEESAANNLIGFAVFFAPYFLIPATFRFAGGVIAAASGGGETGRQRIMGELFGSKDDPNSYWGRWAQQRRVNAGQYKYRQLKKQAAETAAFRDERRGRGALKSKVSAAQAAYTKNPTSGNLKILREAQGALQKRKSKKGYSRAFGDVVKARRGGIPLLNVARFAQLGAERYLTPERALDAKFSTWTKEAKDTLDIITSYGDDSMVYALFGDYDPRSGKKLSPEAIGAARRYRGNQAILNAGLKYILKKQTNADDRRRAINYFASYNPYGNEIEYNYTDRDGERQSHPMNSTFGGYAPGKRRQYEEFEMLKFGMWKGAGFGNQKVHRDLKHLWYRGLRFDGSGDFGRLNDKSIPGFLNEVKNNLEGREFVDFSPGFYDEIGTTADRLAQILTIQEIKKKDPSAQTPKEKAMLSQAKKIGEDRKTLLDEDRRSLDHADIPPETLLKRDILDVHKIFEDDKMKDNVRETLTLLRSDLIDRVNYGFYDPVADDDGKYNQALEEGGRRAGTTWKPEDIKQSYANGQNGTDSGLVSPADAELSYEVSQELLLVNTNASRQMNDAEALEQAIVNISERRIRQIMSRSNITYIPESQEAIARTVQKLSWVATAPGSLQEQEAIAKAHDDLLNFTGIGA